MKPGWKHIYPRIKTAVLNLDSIDSLLQQAVEAIVAAYSSECLLWAGLELGISDALRVYTTPDTINRYASSLGFSYPPTPLLFETDGSSHSVQMFRPRSLPHWLLDQQDSPQLMQLETGELIVPITSRGSTADSDLPGAGSLGNPLQFVLQLCRPFTGLPVLELPIQSPFSTPYGSNTSTQVPPPIVIRGWSPDELDSIEVIASQLGLAYSALYWRHRLEQSRQQAALIGRISRLLNSTLNPDEIVGRIVAELGFGLQCDRSILVDLRNDPVAILAVWDHADRALEGLEHRQVQRTHWQSVIEMFMQGGASYLQIGLNDPEPDSLQTWLYEIGAISALLVPLFIQEEFFGAVALLSYQPERTYLIDELQTVRQVADQAAIALTNAQHYQSLWRKQEVLRMQNSSLQLEIMRDELTQLMNRRSLERELEQLSAGTVWTIQHPFSVIVCDIDYFKLVNDVHGHLVGDEVLQGLAHQLQSQLRRGTPAYRYGGEEFVIILTETPIDQAIDVAERLRRVIRSAPIQTRGGGIETTASFGVAQQDPAYDQSAWDVLHRADRALYDAKRQGRDRVQALDPEGKRMKDKE
jgi:diguanylate cyclase (GGDEF)-like protein